MIETQRSLFAIPDDVAYFNCASLAPLMNAAVEAGRAGLAMRASPWSIATQQWFDGVERRRQLFARIAGVSADTIALVPSTSYGLAIAARNLSARPRQRVLIIAEDYPSAVYTWRRFCERTGATLTIVERPDGDWTEAILAALDESVAIVQVPHVHWTDGALIDLIAVSRRARDVGAKLVVDASQSLGALPLDIAAVRPDYVVTVGYKWLLGPFGLGYLYIADEHLKGEPLEENWINRAGSDNFARLVDYTDDYLAGARRFDVGARTNFEVTPVAIAALEQIERWTVPAIARTLSAITAQIETGVAALGLSLTSSRNRAGHMLGIGLPADALRHVSDRLKAANVFVGVRGSALRIAPHVYTTERDIAALLSALREALRQPPLAALTDPLR